MTQQKKYKKSLLTREMKEAVKSIANALPYLLESDASAIGYTGFVDYAKLGIEIIGQVIKTYNIFSTVRSACRRLIKAGYENAWQAFRETEDDNLRICAINVIGTMTTVFGIKPGDNPGNRYCTPLKYAGLGNVAEHEGYNYVKLTIDEVLEVHKRASMMDGELILSDVEQFALDMEAVKRFYGEYTIDAVKKPEDFLANKPFFGDMNRVNQRSNQALEVGFDKDGKVKTAGMSLEYEDGVDWYLGVPGLRIVKNRKTGEELEREDGLGPMLSFDMVDMYQEIRVKAGKYLVELAEIVSKVPTQQLPKEEISEIATVNRKHGKTLVQGARFMKGIWHSLSNAIRELRAKKEKDFGKKSYAVEHYVKAQKSHNNACYAAVTNQLRIMFEDAGVNDAVTRVRILLSAVMGNLQHVEWDKLSDFAHSALPEEWFIYVMHVMRDDRWTPQETMDKLTLTVELNDEQLARVNGMQVNLQDGMLLSKSGEIIGYVEGQDMNGEFVLRVCDDGIYVCHDVISLVNVPKADRSLSIFITKNDNVTVDHLDDILNNMMDKEVRLVPFDHDAIIVDGKKIGEFRCALTEKVTDKEGNPVMENGRPKFRRLGAGTINGMYGGQSGVRGYVAEVVEGSYDEEIGSRKRCAVVVLKGTVAPMTDEEIDGIGYLSDSTPEATEEVKKPKVDRRAIGRKMLGTETKSLF